MTEHLKSYPLHWPASQHRIPIHKRQQGRFKVSFTQACSDLIQELGRLGARYPVISTNVPLRRDGLPYSPSTLTAAERDAAAQDPGAAVYFEWQGKQYALACDRWQNVAHNLRAIGLTIQALRGLDRWGTSEMLQASFRGFRMLTDGADQIQQETCWTVLEIDPRDATQDSIQAAYRRLVKQAHPDLGGSEKAMHRLNKARDDALDKIDSI